MHTKRCSTTKTYIKQKNVFRFEGIRNDKESVDGSDAKRDHVHGESHLYAVGYRIASQSEGENSSRMAKGGSADWF